MSPTIHASGLRFVVSQDSAIAIRGISRTRQIDFSRHRPYRLTNSSSNAAPQSEQQQAGGNVTDRTVGIIGLGIMGGAIARNLIERGWAVVGFDTELSRRSELERSGVTIAADAGAVASSVATIMTSLPSAEAANAVATQIAGCGQSARIVIELSTFTIADKLHFKAILEPAGHIALDCPLSGTGAQAAVRDLVVYASGDGAAIARCRDLFVDFAKQTADLGAYGNGSRMKFVANLLVAIHNVASAEAMMLAERAGLDLTQVIEMVAPGAGGSRMFQMRAPMMAKRSYEPATMRISTWKKDMAIIAEFASELGCETPLFTTTQPVYAQAMAMGLGDQDTAAVFEVLKANGT
jgi:3-hydroxyisobutyrate dehydrogenase-like beta-hydroxyacid dehydrogenase